MLNANPPVTRPSQSTWSSEVVTAPKYTHDGEFNGWRFCVDYRRVNKRTEKDAYPLPRISELLRGVESSRYFVALDLEAGYWQIAMDPHSIKYTAFRCTQGLFEFLVMPFGLTNAPSVQLTTCLVTLGIEVSSSIWTMSSSMARALKKCFTSWKWSLGG
eukprot:GHVN01085581.1.p1 GENE.GHVN01085581.1~~GHVN01085581.1.p1  ORF type:complete len:159 (-),score=3.38 GHVN01085581.1:716-1192(-)